MKWENTIYLFFPKNYVNNNVKKSEFYELKFNNWKGASTASDWLQHSLTAAGGAVCVVCSLSLTPPLCVCRSPLAGAHDSESSSQAAEGEKCENSSVLFQHVDGAGERPPRSADTAHPSTNTW